MNSQRLIVPGFFPCGRVGEWLKPADCKSAAPCGLRRFESSPVHHLFALLAASAPGEPQEMIRSANASRRGCFSKNRFVKLRCARQTEIAWIAQLVERVLGKDEVTGSIPVPGSRTGCGAGLGDK